MLTIGLLGCGVVGSGVMNLIDDPASDVCRNMRIKRILARSLSEKDDPRLTTNYEDILNDSDIDTVIECMGGDEPAFTYVKAALESGRNVVSSNKKMLAHHLMELEDLAEKHHVSLLMEAAVGGGIPFLCTVHDLEMVEPVTAFEGIFNGTTNYILDSMTRTGQQFSEALKAAQDAGYAERNPTDDIKGYDVRYKVMLSCAAAFQMLPAEDSIVTFGIDRIGDEEFAFAKENGYVIKLIGSGSKNEAGIAACVMPAFVKAGTVLAAIDSNRNGITVKSPALGEATLIGQGAGSLPTAHAVVSDAARILEGKAYAWKNLEKTEAVSSSAKVFYVRGGNVPASLVHSHEGNAVLTVGVTLNELMPYVQAENCVVLEVQA